MKAIGEFLKTTCVGGFFIILPIGLLVLILVKLVDIVSPLAVPIAGFLPEQFRFPVVLALLLLLLISFAAGLLALTRVGQAAGRWIERSTLEHIPGYKVFRSLTHRIGEVEDTSKFAPALVEIEEALVPAFIIEDLHDGHYTVFVPAVPTVATGTVYIIEAARVHHIDAPFMAVAKCVTKFGIGSAELLRSMRHPLPAGPNDAQTARIDTNIQPTTG